LATGEISSYAWSFGDGGTSNAQHPVYEYTASGTYTVTLKVVGPGGENSLTRVNYISVAIPPPTAAFTGFPLSGTVPLTVNFTNASTGQFDSYLWDFGDGGSSSLSDPSHTYLDTGTFSVTLIVVGPSGADTLTFQDYIKVESPLPVASFSADPTTGVSPLLVQFTNSSTGTILSQSWDFGDGGASIDFAPSHQYQNSGVYSVTLALLGPSGVDTLRLTDYITVLAPPPVPDFSADQTSGAAPLDVQFTDLSTGAITAYEWDFGDSTTLAEPSPLHTYSSAGTYSVKLTVTGPGGSNTMTKTDYITVTSLKK
jgi:PKD repeat protein